MNGENFETVFHPMDCWLFYQSLDDAGLIQISKEQRQKVWDEVRGNLSWFEATQRKKYPDKDMVINETKKRLFKNWIIDKIESLEDLEQWVIEKAKNK